MLIVTIASVITAITVIVTTVYKLLKLYDKTQQRCEDLVDLLNKNTLLTYKLVLYSKDFSLEDRIDAGEAYLKLDDDTVIRRYCDRLVEKYEQENFK